MRLQRRTHSGYKVVIVGFADGHPLGEPEDILTGFLSTDGNALGRPVGVAIDRQGALLVADDVGNRVWRVTADQPGGKSLFRATYPARVTTRQLGIEASPTT